MYEFPALRSTVDDPRATETAVSAPIWQQLAVPPPLTGNSAAFNTLFTFINGFNLAASGVVLSQGLTIDLDMLEERELSDAALQREMAQLVA